MEEEEGQQADSGEMLKQYICWGSGIPGYPVKSSILRTSASMLSGRDGLLQINKDIRWRKPVDVLVKLIPKDCSLVVDPCARIWFNAFGCPLSER